MRKGQLTFSILRTIVEVRQGWEPAQRLPRPGEGFKEPIHWHAGFETVGANNVKSIIWSNFLT